MRTALVVDDDDLVRPTVGALLNALNFNVVEAESGKDAFQYISRSNFDLIITDLFMPEIDGIELILKIRKLAPQTPIILMTGGAMRFPYGSGNLNSLTNSAEFFGATHVIHKPFRKHELAKIVEEALSGS